MKRTGWPIGLDVVMVVLVGLIMAWPASWSLGSRIAVAAALVAVGALVVVSRVRAPLNPAVEETGASPAGEVVRQVVGTLTAVALAVMVVSWLVVGARLSGGMQALTTLRTWVAAFELSAAASLLLVGVHLGLDVAGRLLTAPRTVTAVTVGVLTVVAAGGIVGVVTSNYAQWWSAPFAAAPGPLTPGQRTGGYPLPSGYPTTFPSGYPTELPSGYPTAFPSDWPGTRPGGNPTSPTTAPTSQPGTAPTARATPDTGSTRNPGSGPRVNQSGPNRSGVVTWPGLPQLTGVSVGRMALSTLAYAAIAGLVATLIGLIGLGLGRRRSAAPGPGPGTLGPAPVPDAPVAPVVPVADPVAAAVVAPVPPQPVVAPRLVQPPAGVSGPGWPAVPPAAPPPVGPAVAPPDGSVTPPPVSWPVPPPKPNPPVAP